MNTSPAIHALLWIDYSRKEIASIITKSRFLGFNYSVEGEPMRGPHVIDRAIQPNVWFNINFQDTYFDLSFVKDGQMLLVIMSRLGPNWQKKYVGKSDYEIDTQRYIYLMMDLVADYKPVDLKLVQEL